MRKKKREIFVKEFVKEFVGEAKYRKKEPWAQHVQITEKQLSQ